MSLDPPGPLADHHVLSGFDSTEPLLDDWLKNRARRAVAEGSATTYVVCEGDRVVGYYSLAAGSVKREDTPGKVRRNMPEPIPVVVLARLAVDRSYHGKGLGVDLLRDAVLRTREAAKSIGVRAIIAHALHEKAASFYQRFGFDRSPTEELTCLLMLKHADKLLGESG